MSDYFPKPSEPIPIKSKNYITINGVEHYFKSDDKYKGYVYDASTGLLYKEVNNENY